ncbi:DUF58 domain-containing protein [Pseudofrankia asymbiotica]|uniref:Uncharacterized protein n=1 Tax=Pseudofrankia asymbiotica TaxID=1834516 RepID=A0A1V2HZP7_9ACTN|nr:DUF58 domain-containing protein [Pseudofrankia asymbiotica]ONH22357.1 hypothetical protein BL253_35895 [Pseudofrankia asymbiotica]
MVLPSISPAGRGVAVLALTVAGAGALLGYPSFVLLGGGLAGLLAVAAGVVLAGGRARAELAVEPSRPARGDTVRITVHVLTSGRSPWAAGRVAVLGSLARVEMAFTGRRSGDGFQGTATIPASVRGRHRVGPVELVRADPMGLARGSHPLSSPALSSSALSSSDVAATVRVVPRLARLAPPPSARFRQLDGPDHSVLRDGSAAFDTLREFVPGDDPRRMHWPSVARTGELLVRTFVDPGVPSGHVLLDTRAGVYGGGERPAAFEDAVDVAASVLAGFIARDFPVTLAVRGQVTWPAAGLPETTDSMLELLSEVLADDDHGPPALGAAHLREGALGSLVVVTGGHETVPASTFDALARRFTNTTVVHVRPAGHAANAVLATGRMAVVEISDVSKLADLWPGLHAQRGGRP